MINVHGSSSAQSSARFPHSALLPAFQEMSSGAFCLVLSALYSFCVFVLQMAQKMERTLPEIPDIQSAYCLLSLGDSITTDHISPAGNIAKDSPAAKYLMGRGVLRKDFNTYGSRRGNDEVCRASFREA